MSLIWRLGLAILVTIGPMFAPAQQACFDQASGRQRLAPARVRSIAEIRELSLMAFNVENLFLRVGRFERTSAISFRPIEGRGPEPKSEADLNRIRDVIDEADPDVSVITEVESLAALQELAKRLSKPYRSFLIEGNDQRGIDIGFLVKADLPFHITHETHKDTKWFDPVDRVEVPLFSRDVPALLFRKTPADHPSLIVLGNHAKSKRDRPGDPESRVLRTAQYEGIAAIIRSYQSRYGVDVPIVLGGDFNTDIRNGPELAPLRGLLRSSFDVARVSTPVQERITHTFHPRGGATDAKQMDDLQVTASLLGRTAEARVVRYRDANGQVMPFARSFAERERQPSDHLPVLVKIMTQGLW